MEKIVIYTDGGSRGNPGPSAIGYKIIQPSTGEFLCIGEEIGETTNNIAEYTALCESLKVCLCNHVKSVEVYMDSELVVKQIIGNYRVKNINLKPLYEQAKNYISQLSDFSIHHILRGKNKEADRLVNLALDNKARIQEGNLFNLNVSKREDMKEISEMKGYLHQKHLFQDFLMKELKLSYLSVSVKDKQVMIWVSAQEFGVILENRIAIINKAKEFGYEQVVLNLKSYDE